MDLRNAQFELIFGRTVVDRYGIIGRSCDHCSTEHAWVMTPRVWVLMDSTFSGLFFAPLFILRIFTYIYVPEGGEIWKIYATNLTCLIPIIYYNRYGIGIITSIRTLYVIYGPFFLFKIDIKRIRCLAREFRKEGVGRLIVRENQRLWFVR